MTIGDRIRRIRKKRRLTQAELAMMSGLSLSAIQGYEQGRYEPKRKPLESIAEVFKIPVDELYDMPAELGTNLAEVGTDCISRRAAIDAFNTDVDSLIVYGTENAVTVKRYLNGVLEKIKQLPPFQPKSGRWVLVCDNNGMHFICNKCGAWRYHQEQKFCGECGADMREVTE